ncbi:MAG: hypothetical protein KKE44_02750 [Proteobacteria bacterium]|nr:hypothetical protein [Pseudomonadota bacterium]MBU1581645.1 hypothetical protein [Pseudomonadota bacterium]MBU2454552.1 hypothetical protein [Pseudomonadota bacterium]MBU2629305.1 hypothetical protein [Pseudomonadota bacterium]
MAEQEARKKKSEKRIKGKIIPVRVSAEENEKIIELAAKCSQAPSTYLRTLGLEKNIKTTFDSQVIIELARLRSEVGRLGGLVKAWLSPHQKEIGNTPEAEEFLENNKPALKILLRDLTATVLLIEDAVKKI